MKKGNHLVKIKGVVFKKSSFSDYGKSCVGVNIAENKVSIVNTNLKDSPIIDFNYAEWDAFLKGVKKGEFDLLAV